MNRFEDRRFMNKFEGQRFVNKFEFEFASKHEVHEQVRIRVRFET